MNRRELLTSFVALPALAKVDWAKMSPPVPLPPAISAEHKQIFDSMEWMPGRIGARHLIGHSAGTGGTSLLRGIALYHQQAGRRVQFFSTDVACEVPKQAYLAYDDPSTSIFFDGLPGYQEFSPKRIPTNPKANIFISTQVPRTLRRGPHESPDEEVQRIWGDTVRIELGMAMAIHQFWYFTGGNFDTTTLLTRENDHLVVAQNSQRDLDGRIQQIKNRYREVQNTPTTISGLSQYLNAAV